MVIVMEAPGNEYSHLGQCLGGNVSQEDESLMGKGPGVRCRRSLVFLLERLNSQLSPPALTPAGAT